MTYWFESMDSYQIYGRTLDPKRGYMIDDRHFEIAGVPRRFRDCSLDRIPETLPHCKELYNWAWEAAANIDKGRGVALFGDFGAGKTGAAVSLLAEALHVGAYCFFVKALDLNDIYKSREGVAARKKIEKIQFLVLDDIGSARDQDFGVNDEIIEKIVRARYDAELTTVMTINTSANKFLKNYKSIASIISGEYKAINCQGVDWRKEGGEPCLV